MILDLLTSFIFTALVMVFYDKHPEISIGLIAWTVSISYFELKATKHDRLVEKEGE